MSAIGSCPCCGRRVTRTTVLTHRAIRCDGCGVLIRSEGLLNWNMLLGVVLVLCVAAYFGRFLNLVRWRPVEVLALIGVACVTAFLIGLPKRLRFRQVSRGPVCRKCRYELVGCARRICPECGEPIDVAVPPAEDASS